jgi:predicted small lipoprotein YifL
MSQLKLYFLVLVMIIVTTVAGCGQTGDLYLPEDEPQQKSKDQSK